VDIKYFIDETSLNLNFRPQYGYGEKGKALGLDWLTPKSKNYTFIGVVTNYELLNFCIFEGGMRGKDFYYFLLKTIDKFSIIGQKIIFVLDNLFCHKLCEIYPTIKDSINLLFLPINSPMLNPIEYFFSYMKRELRKNRYEDLDILMLELNILIRNIDEDLLRKNERHTLKLLRDILCNKFNEF
jgi:transposase